MTKFILLVAFTSCVAIACGSSSSIEEGTLEINGASLFYKTMGSGDPIVVLHGGPGFDHRQFLPYIWELASRHKVILYDQRGTGLSSGPIDAESISLDTFIADLEGIREAFGIEKMNLFGHSWGGTLAMHYALRHEDKLKSLIICSATASEDAFEVMRTNYEANRAPEDAERIREIYYSDEYQKGDPQAVESFWRVFFKPYFADQSLVSGLDLNFTENTIKNGETVARYLLESVAGFDLHEDLEAIRVPTLIIHGDSDPMPVECAERIHRSIEGSKLVITRNSGHWVFVDATETFTSSILDFLEE